VDMANSAAAQQISSSPSHVALGADLTALAGEATSEKRLELLRRITDAFVEHGDHATAAEQYLFNEVVSKLLEKVSPERRSIASEKLASMAKLPDALASKLAGDADIAVARPIIRDYGPLPERILLDVSRNGSQEHLDAIAGRTVVTPPVSDIVVARGDRGTIRKLAANRGAQFSDAGMQRLIDKSAGDGDLQAVIVERPDLSLGAIGRLLPLISDELASRLRDVAVNVDEKVVERHVAEWAAERHKNSSRTDAYIDGIRAGDLKPNDVIGELVAGKRLLDAATVLGALLELERFYTFNLMTEGKIHSALLLLRSIDLSWKVADAFIKLRIAKAGLYDYETPPTQGDYEAIDIAAAQRVIRFMKVRRATKAE
jgi:hypothetical protein